MTQFGKLILSLSNRQEQEFLLEKSTIILGRGATSDITLSDAKVSRSHARLQCSAAACTLIDLGSANGMRVNGEQVERAFLAPGDVIGIGDSTLRFEVETPELGQEIISIDSEADLDATLAQATVPMTLANTDVPRIAVHTLDKTWEVLLTQEVLSIGRQAGSDLMLDQGNASRHHARIERVGDEFRLRDLGSTNGTWLDSQRIDERLLRNGDTIRIGSARLVFKGGFGMEDLTLFEGEHPLTGPKRASACPPVVFVPGMMGSELWRGSERLWPNVKVMFTEPELFRFKSGEAMEARGIVGEVVLVPNLVKQQRYSRLGDYLEEALGYERGRDVFEFAYDWRQDNRLSAQQLAEAVKRWAVTQPITLIAHSLGCIVSRYYVERLGGKHKVGRLILLGGPHAGYPRAISHLLSGPGILPFGILGERVRKVIATFPALYQILPTSTYVVDQTGTPIDVLSDEAWLPAEHRPLLRDARVFRRELGTQTSVPTVSIFGYGQKTITGLQVQRTLAGQWQQVDFNHNEVGDTDVPTASAVLAGSEIHPVQQHHGALYVDNDVKMRLKVELTR
jgi:pSer/pThr/pTyr-binding forkhead associated (FHA) protein